MSQYNFLMESCWLHSFFLYFMLLMVPFQFVSGSKSNDNEWSHFALNAMRTKTLLMVSIWCLMAMITMRTKTLTINLQPFSGMDRTPHITEHPHSQTVRTHHSCLYHLCQLRHHQIIIFLINKLILPSLSSWMILKTEWFAGTKERTPDPQLHGRWESRTKHNLVREQ